MPNANRDVSRGFKSTDDPAAPVAESISLACLNIGDIGLITGLIGLPLALEDDPYPSQINDSLRLLEMGFVPGSLVSIRHRAPLGGDPLVAEVNDAAIGIRLSDARLISVRKTCEG